MSKAALDGLGLASSWAIELRGRQITVNVVAPGPIETLLLADPGRSATPPKPLPLGGFKEEHPVWVDVTHPGVPSRSRWLGIQGLRAGR